MMIITAKSIAIINVSLAAIFLEAGENETLVKISARISLILLTHLCSQFGDFSETLSYILTEFLEIGGNRIIETRQAPITEV